MKKIISLVVGIGILLGGCMNLDAEPIVESATQEHPQLTPSNVATLPPVRNTPTQVANDQSVIHNCINNRSESPLQDAAKIGTVVLGIDDNTPIYLLTLETGTRYDLPFESNGLLIDGIAVSPDGDRLAYIESIQDQAGSITRQKIWVVNAKGEVLASQSIDPKVLFSEWQWVDNERLQFQVRPETIRDGTVAIVNPFTKEWKYLSNELPNFYTSFDLSPVWWLVNYNPNLNFVAYLGSIEGNGLGTIVRDVTTQKTIWESHGSAVGLPKWSPLGNEVAVVMDSDLHLIDVRGQETSLPELEYGNDISEFSWSPDGNYIAFWARYDQRTKADLMVYNIGKNQITNYCISGDGPHAGLSVWSMNSGSFVASLYSAERSQEITVLVDVQQNIAYEIPKGMEPLGWMKSIP